MKPRTLVVLGLVLVVLAAAVWLAEKKPAAAAGSLKTGAAVFALDDFNKVRDIVINDGTQTLELAKSAKGWVVPKLWDYPASFDRVADELLNKYSVLKVGQTQRGTPADFGLDEKAADSAKRPAIVHLRDEQKKDLAVLKVGAERTKQQPGAPPGMGGYPDGQYIQVGDGPVVLVDQYVGRPSTQGRDWMDTKLLNVDAESIAEVDILDKSGKTYGLIRTTNGTFAAKSKADKEELKNEGAQAVFGAISYLNFFRVSSPFQSQQTMLTNITARYHAKTRDGIVYNLDLCLPWNDNERFAHLTVGYEKPAPPPAPAKSTTTNAPAVDPMKTFEEKCAETKKLADEKNAFCSYWFYTLEESSTMNLALPREQVLAVPPPPTNAVPATVTNSAPVKTVLSPPVSAPPAPAK